MARFFAPHEWQRRERWEERYGTASLGARFEACGIINGVELAAKEILRAGRFLDPNAGLLSAVSPSHALLT